MYRFRSTHLHSLDQVSLFHGLMHQLKTLTLIFAVNLYSVHCDGFVYSLDPKQIWLLEQTSWKKKKKLHFQSISINFQILTDEETEDWTLSDEGTDIFAFNTSNGCENKICWFDDEFAICAACRLAAAANWICCWILPLDFECCINCGNVTGPSYFNLNSGAFTLSLFWSWPSSRISMVEGIEHQLEYKYKDTNAYEYIFYKTKISFHDNTKISHDQR